MQVSVVALALMYAFVQQYKLKILKKQELIEVFYCRIRIQCQKFYV